MPLLTTLVMPYCPSSVSEAAAQKDGPRTLMEDLIKEQLKMGLDIPSESCLPQRDLPRGFLSQLADVQFDPASEALPAIKSPLKLQEQFLALRWSGFKGITENPVKLILPGPGYLARSASNEFYSTDRGLTMAFAELLNFQIKSARDAGCVAFQVVEPIIAGSASRLLEYGIEALERTFRGIPSFAFRMVHFPLELTEQPLLDSSHPYAAIAEAIDDSTVSTVALEDPTAKADLRILEKFARTDVCITLVTSETPEVESSEQLNDRLVRALEHIDAERLMVSADRYLERCDRQTAIAKVQAMVSAVKARRAKLI